MTELLDHREAAETSGKCSLEDFLEKLRESDGPLDPNIPRISFEREALGSVKVPEMPYEAQVKDASIIAAGGTWESGDIVRFYGTPYWDEEAGTMLLKHRLPPARGTGREVVIELGAFADQPPEGGKFGLGYMVVDARITEEYETADPVPGQKECWWYGAEVETVHGLEAPATFLDSQAQFADAHLSWREFPTAPTDPLIQGEVIEVTDDEITLALYGQNGKQLKIDNPAARGFAYPPMDPAMKHNIFTGDIIQARMYDFDALGSFLIFPSRHREFGDRELSDRKREFFGLLQGCSDPQQFRTFAKQLFEETLFEVNGYPKVNLTQKELEWLRGLALHKVRTEGFLPEDLPRGLVWQGYDGGAPAKLLSNKEEYGLDVLAMSETEVKQLVLEAAKGDSFPERAQQIYLTIVLDFFTWEESWEVMQVAYRTVLAKAEPSKAEFKDLNILRHNFRKTRGISRESDAELIEKYTQLLMDNGDYEQTQYVIEDAASRFAGETCLKIKERIKAPLLEHLRKRRDAEEVDYYRKMIEKTIDRITAI